MEGYTDVDEKERGLFKRREPFQFMLWLAIVGMSLVFVALLFFYAFGKNKLTPTEIALPKIFWLSSVFIILSSFTIHQAQKVFYLDNFRLYTRWLVSTFILGLMFIISQLLGWQDLYQQKIFLNGHPSGSYLYVISGLHIVHLLGGILYLGLISWEAIRHISYVDSFIYSVNPPNQLRLKLLVIYWHFVDILWIFIFLFFLYHFV